MTTPNPSGPKPEFTSGAAGAVEKYQYGLSDTDPLIAYATNLNDQILIAENPKTTERFLAIAQRQFSIIEDADTGLQSKQDIPPLPDKEIFVKCLNTFPGSKATTRNGEPTLVQLHGMFELLQQARPASGKMPEIIHRLGTFSAVALDVLPLLVPASSNRPLETCLKEIVRVEKQRKVEHEKAMKVFESNQPPPATAVPTNLITTVAAIVAQLSAAKTQPVKP